MKHLIFIFAVFLSLIFFSTSTVKAQSNKSEEKTNIEIQEFNPDDFIIPETEYVNGYFKSDGTYVPGYFKTKPDKSIKNNYSTDPNVNPFTGKKGSKSSKSSKSSNSSKSSKSKK